MKDAEGHGSVDLEPAARLAAVPAGLLLRLLHLLHDAGTGLAVAQADLGQGQAAGGAVDEAHPQPLLQCGDVLADGGLGQAQRVGGGGEAAQLGHLREHRHACEPVHSAAPGHRPAGIGPDGRDLDCAGRGHGQGRAALSARIAVALAQINPVLGDIEGNAGLIREARARAAAAGADLVLLPELCVVGYPPEDLVLKPAVCRARPARGRAARRATPPTAARP